MFEGVVASILNKYLGKYIQNLDTENLNLGIFSGTVELTDLKLKPEALYELDLPIEVKAGSVGKISLDIPWTSLYSEPVIVNVEEVFLLAGPITDRNYDPDLERALSRAEKRKKLDDLTPKTVSIDDDDEESEGFFERLTTTIVNNLQIAIRNVHIRYEDVITDKTAPLACGIMLQSVTVSTTNSKWKPSQIDANAATIFKLIKLESLSIYWNPNCSYESLARSHLLTNNWKNIMYDGLTTFSIQNEDFDFMVKPISAKIKVILSKSNDSKVPKLLVDFLLQDAASQFSRDQYLSVLKLIQSIQRMNVNKQYIKYRPTVPLKNHASAWWNYAYESIAESLIRPYSWQRIKQHREKYREYKSLFKKKLLKPMDTEVKLDLQKLEDKLDVVNILLAREHAKLEFIKEEPERAKRKKKKNSSWWSSWFGSDDEDEEVLEVSGEDSALWSKLTAEEKEKLYEAIGYTEGEKSPNKPIQYIEHKLNFTLANCALSLVNQNHEILVMSLTQFLMSIETRPSAKAFRLSARTESFVVEGASIENDLVPIITADHATSGASVPHVFAFDFEKNPLHVDSDFGLSINAEPMEIVYHEHSISDMISYFAVENDLVANLKNAAKEKLQNLAQTSQLALMYAIEQRKKISVNIDLKSPYFVVPSKGTMQKGGNLLVLDLGRLSIKSDMHQDNIALEDATRMEIEERLYDRFNIVLSEIQVLFADSGDPWRENRLLPESESHIMPKMRIQLMFSNNVKPDYKQIPKQKLNVSIPSLKLNISDQKIRLLIEFAQNLPLPKFELPSADVVDGIASKEILNVPDASTIPMIATTNDLATIKELLVTDRYSLSKKIESKLDTPVTKTQMKPSTPSDQSDEEPEEWARMVDLPGFDDNVSPSNTINSLLRFLIGEIVIQLARSGDHFDKPYLMLRVNKLCTDVAFMEYGSAIQASVGGFQLVDKLHRGTSGEYLELMNSSGSSDMITFLYRKVKANCPEFKSHFHSVEQSIVLDITYVSAMFHRGAFITLSKYLQYVLEKVKSKFPSRKNSKLLQNTPDPSSLLMSSENDPPVPSGATKLSVSARIDEIKFKLCDSDMDFAEFKISGLESDLVQKANEKMIIRAHLTDVSLIDLTESTLYPKIISIEDDKVFEFKFVKHSTVHKQSTFGDTDSVNSDGSVRLRIGRIQVVILYKFICDFYHFVEPFIHPDFTVKAMKSAEEAVQKQANDIKIKGTRLSLSIEIHAPTLLIPQKSSSPNLLAIMLGDLSIENFFKEVSVPSAATSKTHIIDNLLIRLNSVQMSRALILLNGHMETQESILDPIKLRLDIKRSVSSYQHDFLLYDIQGNIDVIKINIGQRDVGTFLAIYHENFSESQFEKTSSSRPLSPVTVPTPITSESEDVKKLEAFLNTSIDIYKEMNISFILEGIQLTLYMDSEEILSSPLREASHGLSRFEMDEVTLSVLTYSDRALELKIALQAVTLLDIRADSGFAVKKIFQSYSGDSKDQVGPISISRPPMIDVTYKQTRSGDAMVDVLVERTRLNVSIPYILAVTKFFYEALPIAPMTSSVEGSDSANHNAENVPSQTSKIGYADLVARKRHPSDTTSGYHSTTSASSPLEEISALSISAKLKKPEVILFADPTDENSKVLVLKTNIYLDYSRNLGQENFVGSISDLRIFSCTYGKQRQTANMVLHPTDAEITRSLKSGSDDASMTINLSDISVVVSASTVHSVTEVVQQILVASEIEPEEVTETKELFDLWAPKKILPHKWISTEDNVYVKPQYPSRKPSETLSLVVPSIYVLFEIEEGVNKVPMVALKSAVEANINNWSKQIFLKAELQLEIMYYNEKLSIWEPLIEPIMEHENSYRPWEVIIKIFKERGHPLFCQHDLVDGPLHSQSGKNEMTTSNSQKFSEDQSSESEDNSDNLMTIVKKPKIGVKRLRNTMSRENSSLVGNGNVDSDSETEEGMMEKIASAFNHLFSSGDSSDDEIQDSEDETSGEIKQKTQVSEDATDLTDNEVLYNDEAPVFVNSPSKGTDVVDKNVEDSTINLATYFLIDSRDKLNISMTPTTIDVLSRVYKAYATDFDEDNLLHLTVAQNSQPIQLRNYLGPSSSVKIIECSDGDEETLLTASSDSTEPNLIESSPSTGMLVDIAQSDYDLNIDEEESDGYSVLSAMSHTGVIAASVGGIKVVDDETNLLYEQMNRKRVSVEMEGFETLTCMMLKRAGTRVFSLQPLKTMDKTRYHVAIDIDMHNDKTHVAVQSLLKLKNNLDIPVHIYFKKSTLDSLGLPSPPSKNPFQDNVKLATLSPGEIYHVPLYVAYHCKLFVQPFDVFNDSTPRYQTSGSGIAWQELVSLPSGYRHFVCKPTANSDSNFVMKITRKEGIKFQNVNNKLVPNYTLSIDPPVIFHNYLPCPIELLVKETDERFELTAGQQCPVTVLDNLKSQLVQVEVTQYLGIPWSGSLELTLDMEDHKTITMKTEHDTDGGNKQLGISIKVQHQDSLNIYLFVPYWIVNKTKLPVQLRGSGSDIVYESNAVEDPLLFRFRKHRKRKARLRVYNSAWSSLFSLDTVGSCGVVICSDKERNKNYQFLMDIQISSLQLSKIITITPYFLINNLTRHDLMFMEENKKTDLWLDLQPNQCIPFWPDTSSMKLYIKYRDSKITSQHFPIDKPHNSVLRMDNGSALSVDVSGGLTSPIVVNIQPYIPGFAPARVENMCEDLFIKIHQKNMSQVTLLSPYQSVLYTWDDPSEERTLIWNLYNRKKPGYVANIFTDGFGQETLTFHSLRKTSQSTPSSRPSSFAVSSSDDDDSDAEEGSFHPSKMRTDKVVVHWVSYMDGCQRVLLFTQDERVAVQARKDIDETSSMEMFMSLHGVGLSLINGTYKEIAYASINSAPAIWEVEINGKMKLLNVELSTWLEDNFAAEQVKAELKDYIHVDFSKMYMTKPFFGQLKRSYKPALWFQLRKSKHQMYVHTKIHRIQIDNQLPDAIFPTAFWPSPLPEYVVKKNGTKPLIEFSAMKISSPKSNINNFKFIKLLIQEFNIMLDKGFLLSLYDIISVFIKDEDEVKKMKKDLLTIHTSLKDTAASSTSLKPQLLMIDYLHLSPLKMNFSFSLRGTVYKSVPEASTLSQDVIEFFLDSVGATFSEVKNIEMKMAYLEKRSSLMSPAHFLEDIKSHYISQIIQQSYVLILGLDILGNPYGLIKDFTQGLGDLFYEPFLGSIQGPEEFAVGISRGMQSLFGHVIGGTAESVSLITGSLGQAISVLSFDEDYKKKRRLRMLQHKDTIPATISGAAKGFVLGIALGLSGVVVKPITGAQQEGIEGFFKGIGKGLLGLVTKPAVGVFDMVSMAFDGIRRAAEMGEDVVVRIRLLRYINPKQGLKPFSPYQATGLNILLHLSKGHYAETDIYYVHAALSKEDRADIALITDRHVFLLERCRFWGSWDIEWELKIDDIMSLPQIQNNKLIFKVKKEESFTFFSDDEKYIACDDKLVLKWLQAKIEKVLMTNLEEKPCPGNMIKD